MPVPPAVTSVKPLGSVGNGPVTPPVGTAPPCQPTYAASDGPLTTAGFWFGFDRSVIDSDVCPDLPVAASASRSPGATLNFAFRVALVSVLTLATVKLGRYLA